MSVVVKTSSEYGVGVIGLVCVYYRGGVCVMLCCVLCVCLCVCVYG